MAAEREIETTAVSAFDAKTVGKNDDTTVHEIDAESAAEEGSEKPKYSKLSVWLMVLYSGLAIGSDG